MSRFLCACGHTLSNSTEPEIVHYVMPFDKWAEHSERVAKQSHDPDLPEMEFWKCPNCKRLHFFEGQNDKPLCSYVLEK